MEIPLSIGECIVSAPGCSKIKSAAFLGGSCSKTQRMDLASQKEDPREQSGFQTYQSIFSRAMQRVGTKSVSHLLISTSIHVDRGM